MQSLRRLSILLLFLVNYLADYGQLNSPALLRFKQFTAKDGLLSAPVRTIYQDKAGYIRFCTYDGLQRFDGKNFKTFYSNPNNPNSLASDVVNDIRQDKLGRYWIAMGDNGGLCSYNPSKETYTRFNATTSKEFSENGNKALVGIPQKVLGRFSGGTFRR